MSPGVFTDTDGGGFGKPKPWCCSSFYVKDDSRTICTNDILYSRTRQILNMSSQMLTNNTVINCKTELSVLCEEKINVPTRIVISAIITFRKMYFKIGYLSVLCFKYKINIERNSIFLSST